MSIKPNTLALVVTFNRKNLLLECIKALKNQKVKCDILVVDNASTDGTFETIEHLIDGEIVQYINTGSNLGGAGGFNFALREAANRDYEYFWLMDDDTIAHENTLEEFLNASAGLENNFGYLSSFAKFTDGTPCKMNKQELSKDWQKGIEKYPGIIKIDRATFVSFLLKKDTVLELGLPIKEFFIWADDSEYSLRISSKYDSYVVLSSEITHKMAVNANTDWKTFIQEDSDRISRYFYNFRNRLFLEKQKGILSALWYLMKSIVVSFIALTMSKTRKFQKFTITWKGLLSGIVFNPKIEYVNRYKDE